MRPFVPVVSNPHLLTIAGNFWPRRLDERRYPVEEVLFRTAPDTRVLIHSQRPAGAPRGEVVLVHGLEGSSGSGYMRSMAQAALEAGFGAHRFNLRGCGGSEALSPTMYNAGLTSDLLAFLKTLAASGRGPLFLVGYSLGGNVGLKLAGELGEQARPLLAGLCAVSTPIDLAVCVRKLAEPQNFLYQRRFLRKLNRRVSAGRRRAPRSVWEFDERYTAKLAGYRDAAHYYETCSATRFLDRIRVPALLIQAADDPVVPFHLFAHPALKSNPWLKLLPLAHGGHLGFLARRRPRFWSEEAILEWIGTNPGRESSLR